MVDRILARITFPPSLVLRSTVRGLEIFADPLLERVFYNLLDNTIRHSKRATFISLSCQERPKGLAILWEDDGTGIPDTEKEEIFERGFGKNTGLGLFLVREILAITGISIRETGTAGQGAKFEIIVPAGTYRFDKDNTPGNALP